MIQKVFIYAKNRVRKTTLQHLVFCLLMNYTTSFTTIDNLLNHFGDIFGNAYQKEHTVNKFRE